MLTGAYTLLMTPFDKDYRLDEFGLRSGAIVAGVLEPPKRGRRG